jgi:hypothetical protein
MDNPNKNEQQEDLPKTKSQEVSTENEDGILSTPRERIDWGKRIVEALKRAENFDKEGLMDF